jgi:hypothetical protein
MAFFTWEVLSRATLTTILAAFFIVYLLNLRRTFDKNDKGVIHFPIFAPTTHSVGPLETTSLSILKVPNVNISSDEWGNKFTYPCHFFEIMGLGFSGENLHVPFFKFSHFFQ